MQTDIQPAHPTETVFDVQQRMAESKIDALPVTEAGRLLGILTAQDINEAYRLKANQPDLLPVRQI
jgi:CBS domain-containing protein